MRVTIGICMFFAMTIASMFVTAFVGIRVFGKTKNDISVGPWMTACTVIGVLLVYIFVLKGFI